MLTAMPTSTSQTIVKVNVRNMSERSTHARILWNSIISIQSCLKNEREHSLPEILHIVRCFRQEAEHDKTDADKSSVREKRFADGESHLHGGKHTFRKEVQPRKQEEDGEQHNTRAHDRCHLRACTNIAVDP